MNSNKESISINNNNKNIKINNRNNYNNNKKNKKNNNYINNNNLKICQVCKINEKKYKCPTCKILYCSKECYQAHKKDGTCERLKEKVDEEKKKQKELELASDGSKNISTSSSLRKRKHGNMDGGDNNNKDEDEDGYILPMEDYNRLIHTEKFKRYFLDKRFQKVVKEINSADNRREMLQENIKNDKYFSDIVDELLLILGIAGTDEAGNLTVS